MRRPVAKNVRYVQFGTLSDAQWRKLASVEVKKPLKKNETTDGTCNDEKMGVLENEKLCKNPLCGKDNSECPGHFGLIELVEPVLNPVYVSTVISILKMVCIGCSQLRAALTPTELALPPLARYELLKAKAAKKKSCAGCGLSLPGSFRYSAGEIYVVVSDLARPPGAKAPQRKAGEGAKKKPAKAPLLATKQILQVLARISDADLPLLGMNLALSAEPLLADPEFAPPGAGGEPGHAHAVRPETFILTVLPVVPPACRPFVMKDGEKKDDDLTEMYNQVVKQNAKLGAAASKKLSAPEREVCRKELKSWVCAILDNTISKRVAPGTKREYKGYRERLEGKGGQFRNNIGGKRSDQNARTVITAGGPLLRVDEVGVPRLVAEKLTRRESVTRWNLEHCQRLLDARQVPAVKRRGAAKLTNVATATRNYQAEFRLEVGDAIQRHLPDGLHGVLNRQPSLTKASVQAPRIRVFDDELGFRLPLAVCRPYNADFDGDEMNLHIAQAVQAGAECAGFMAVEHHIVSSQNNSPVIAPVQNAALGLFLATFAPDGRDPEVKTAFFNDMVVSTTRDAKELAAAMARYWDLARRAAGVYPRHVCRRGGRWVFGPSVPARLMVSFVLPAGLSLKVCVGEAQAAGAKVRLFFEVRAGLVTPASQPMDSKASKAVVHHVHKLCGPRRCCDMISEMQVLGDRYVQLRGFSMGVSACVLADPEGAVAQRLGEMEAKCAAISASALPAGRREEAVVAETKAAMGIVPTLAKRHMNGGARNALVVMKLAGAKGNDVNTGQIAAFVGQQNIKGGRVTKYLSGGTRALPHFAPGDPSPAAGGFVREPFLRGLDFRAAFFHGMAGRDGVISTSTKTGETGYIQKKLGKKTEDFRVWHDLSVRNARGEIVMYTYGEDGLAPEELIPVTGKKALPFPFFVDARVLARSLDDPADPSPPARLGEASLGLAAKMLSYGSGMDEDPLNPLCLALGNMRACLQAHLAGVRVRPAAVPEFLVALKDMFDRSVVEPGTMVGLSAALAIGEVGTQLNLNSFRFAGQDRQDVSAPQGVGRLKALLNATKRPAAYSATLCLRPEVDAGWAASLARELEQVCLAGLLAEPPLMERRDAAVEGSPSGLRQLPVRRPRWWARLAGRLARPPGKKTGSPESEWSVVLRLDRKKLGDHCLSVREVARKLAEFSLPEAGRAGAGKRGSLVGVSPLASPDAVGEIELRLHFTPLGAKAEVWDKAFKDAAGPLGMGPGNREFFIVRDVLLPALAEVRVKGVEGVQRAQVAEADGRLFVKVAGPVFADLFFLAEVDPARSWSDDPWTMLRVFGVEAARSLYLAELSRLIGSGGTYINRRHYQIVADAMTRTGTIKGATRDGIVDEVDPIAKGLFERSVKFFAAAAARSERDHMQGVAASVMLGTYPPVGTGCVEIRDAERAPLLSRS